MPHLVIVEGLEELVGSPPYDSGREKVGLVAAPPCGSGGKSVGLSVPHHVIMRE